MTNSTAAAISYSVPSEVLVTEVVEGSSFHASGRNSVGREVTAVVERCNCEGATRTIDPETREPLHYPVTVIECGERFSAVMPRTARVWAS
jgi:hypothetical protein